MATASSSSTLDALRAFLAEQPPGEVAASDVEPLLAGAWDDLTIVAGKKTESYKLVGRVEQVQWKPPVLEFKIERHGSLVLGGTRAEMYRWTVDVDRATAEGEASGHRQVKPMARRVPVKSIASKIAALISAGEQDARLDWSEDMDEVCIRKDEALPLGGYAKTVNGRKRRLRDELDRLLADMGWEHVRPWRYRRKSS